MSDKNNENILYNSTLNIGGAVVGAIVGLTFGGPVGAIAGATTSPVINTIYSIFQQASVRRKERIEKIFNDSVKLSNLNEQHIIDLLAKDTLKTDTLIHLLNTIGETDSALDGIFSKLIADLLASENSVQQERLLIMSDSVKNLRRTHLRVLTNLFESNRQLPARDLSAKLEIPEIELRSIVRDLELRGMIKEYGDHPVTWHLRELGEAIVVLSLEKSFK